MNGDAAPGYAAPLIAACLRGEGSDHMHYGYWSSGRAERPGDPTEFAAAQARMAELHLEALGPPAAGGTLVDVGCGLGGTLRLAAERWPEARLIGVNIDARQLEVAARLAPPTEGGPEWIMADACATPLPDASADAVLSLEAAFHFSNTARFFAEAARLLRPGGRLAVSDILLDRTGLSPSLAAFAEWTLQAEYGPWPHPWRRLSHLRSAAAAAGFRQTGARDLRRQTSPSYGVMAPRVRPLDVDATAVQILRALHEAGRLSYPLLTFEKPAR